MKVYFDNCCYCRPYDTHQQIRVKDEAQAILDIAAFCKTGHHNVIGSSVIEFEMGKIGHAQKLRDAQRFYNDTISSSVDITNLIVSRATLFQAQGVKIPDCYHLACAESVGADYLLTTDDRFESACAKMRLVVRVMNPTKFPFIGDAV